MDDQYFEHNPDSSSPATPGSPVVGPSRIRKVAALSDFAPVNTKVPRLVLPVRVAELPLISGAVRRNKRYKHKRHDFWFLLLRWPLLVSMILVIALAPPHLNHEAIYLSIYWGGIWIVCACTTAGEWERVDFCM